MRKPPYAGLKIRVQLVREGTRQEYGKRISSSQDVVELVAPDLNKYDREVFLSLLLNTKNMPIGVEEVSIGCLNSSIIHPRELFKSAVLASASSLILIHNHPSGDPEASREDLELTKRLVKAGELMGIKILDHVIIAGERFLSLLDRGLMNTKP